MPIAGYRDVNGVPVKLADIHPIKDAARFNCSPATLALLLDEATGRKGLNFTASMIGKTPRQHILEADDYYPPTAQMMSAHMGTMRHASINLQREGLIVEQRFTSKRDPRLSAQIDHAAIVELTDDGTLVVDLYDLKTTKWYSTTLCAKDIWKNHPDYGWQINLGACLLEEEPENSDLLHGYWCEDSGAYDCRAARIRVRDLWLEFIPPDAGYKNAGEASILGLPEYQKVLVKVERRAPESVYAAYAAAIELRDKTLAEGYAPICEDRWSNKTIRDLRCKHYCQYAAECKAFSLSRGEGHPLATEEEIDAALVTALEKSIEQQTEARQ